MLALAGCGLALCGAILADMARAADSTPADGVRLRIAFVGDVMLADGPGREIRAGRDPFAGFAKILDGADLRIANLECVIATSGRAEAKPWTFRAHPRVIPLLKRHLDAVSVANNHSGDFGRAAFSEMLERLRQNGLAAFGGGANLRAAHEPLIVERMGLRIALLGYDEYFPRSFEAGEDFAGVAWSEDEQVTYDIQRARRHYRADIVIPFMHWGQEHESRANTRQRALARRMIDAGADAVVGTHPHVVQDVEVYRDKLIVYSLGNFIFDGFHTEASNTGWLLWLEFGRAGVTHWHIEVARIDHAGSPRPAGRQSTPPVAGR